MKRRALLTSITVGAATVAGCIGKLNRDENDERKYEACNHSVLRYRNLPDDVKTEVDTALNEGHYVSDEQLLWQQVAGPEVEALVQGTRHIDSDGEIEDDTVLYAPQVDVTNGTHIIEFEEITPHLTVVEVPEVPLHISITIKYTSGTIVKEIDLPIKQIYSSPEVSLPRDYGSYIVEVTVEDWGTESVTVHSPKDISLSISENDISLSIPKTEGIESSGSADDEAEPSDSAGNTSPAVCPWAT
ncbi:hypothetical protein [Natrinema halophilum]|uniref:Uncharacterized protein n=1 Tax=Natrinema halophilum TaxID=1699371 RepID=A0A7D5GJV0_9EURY|nr:hypothetical protein [Natrinema halophilum]QLG48710.1 hypothetical protein HYG82_07545 [Natrinema halophilum]